MAISIPSNTICPEVGSINLKKDVANVDLPQPIIKKICIISHYYLLNKMKYE